MKIKFHPRGKPSLDTIKGFVNEAIEDIRTAGDLEIDDDVIKAYEALKAGIIKSCGGHEYCIKSTPDYIVYQLENGVEDGQEHTRGLKRFSDMIDPDQIESLKKYINNKVNNPLEDED